MKVSDLIDPNTRGWRQDLVDALFLSRDREEICTIPLSLMISMM